MNDRSAQFALQTALTRRMLLRAGGLGSVVVLGGALSALLAACGESADSTGSGGTGTTGGATPTPSGQGASGTSSDEGNGGAVDLSGRELTFASWGGAYQDAQKQAYCDPFAEKFGVTIHQDGPVDNAKIRTMAESGAPTWDVVDVTDTFLFNAAKEGLFEPIDTSIVDTSQVLPEYVHGYGIGAIVWSYNIGYNTNVFPTGSHPQSWADVFDLEKFPGKRTLPANSPAPNLEVALMADGVDPKDLYPLDVDRAFRKLDTIKHEVIWWETNSQSQQLFADEEVVTGLILNGRAYDIVKEGAPIAIEWNQNIQSVDYLVVLKGSKNVDVAMHFINHMMGVEPQALVANLIAYAPTNPEAFDLIDPEVAPWLSTYPENLEKGFLINAEYWRDHLREVEERWTAWRLS